MFWAMVDGQGHGLLDLEDGVGKTACGLTVEDLSEDDLEEATVPMERPYGADSCRGCHAIFKGYTTGSIPIPDGLFTPPVATKGGVMSAADRRARVEGRAGTSTASSPSGSPRGSRGLPEDVDDLAYPAETPAPTVDGALLVTPETKNRGKASRRAPEDAEFDSET